MANEEMRDRWAARGGSWVQNERLFDRAFTPFTAAVVESAGLGTARRVLDVGCGAGTLLEAAVAAGAGAVGVDISPTMAEAARVRVPAATVVTADAQSADLLALAPGEPFDRVVSRFGVMFFEDPAAAFANIRAAAAPGGRLAFVCWREDEVDMFTLGLAPLLARMRRPPEAPQPDRPGGLGFARAERIRTVLDASGWTDASIAPLDAVTDYADGGSDGVEERLAVALSGSVGRAAQAELEPLLGPEGWRAALDEARADLRGRFGDGPVRFECHTWLVTAANPA